MFDAVLAGCIPSFSRTILCGRCRTKLKLKLMVLVDAPTVLCCNTDTQKHNTLRPSDLFHPMARLQLGRKYTETPIE
jgi:hypothetical protein